MCTRMSLSTMPRQTHKHYMAMWMAWGLGLCCSQVALAEGPEEARVLSCVVSFYNPAHYVQALPAEEDDEMEDVELEAEVVLVQDWKDIPMYVCHAGAFVIRRARRDDAMGSDWRQVLRCLPGKFACTCVDAPALVLLWLESLLALVLMHLHLFCCGCECTCSSV